MAYGRKQLKRGKIFSSGGYVNYQIAFLVFVLLAFGVMMVYSASSYRAAISGLPDSYFAKRQGMIGLAGLVIMWFLSHFNYQNYRKPFMHLLILCGMIGCSGIALIIGISSHGAKRWVSIAGVQVQPSEMVKLFLILYLSHVCVKHASYLHNPVGIIKLIWPCLLSILLIAKENLSTAIVCAGIMVVILLIVTPDVKPILLGMLLLAGVAALFTFGVGYRVNRIEAWLSPETSEYGYQTMQSLYAIGSGGLFGKGLGQSIQKLGFLPESHNDMIFAIVCEELGIFGALGIIALFLILILQLRYVANHARDRFGALIVIGVMTHIAVQMLVNIGVVTNVIPNTGVTLPFISYGGSSLLFLLAEMGFVMNVSRQMIPYEEEPS